MPSRLRHFLRPWNIPEALAPGLRALNRVTKAHHRTTDHLVHYLGHHTVKFMDDESSSVWSNDLLSGILSAQILP